MPILEAIDRAGNLLPDAEARIWATMLVPGGPADHWWQVHRAAWHEEQMRLLDPPAFAIDRASFRYLYEHGRAAIEEDARKRQVAGEHVGELLLVIHQLALHAPDRASYAEADRLIMCDMAKISGDRTPFKWSEPKRRECWAQYKAVAALWGAFRCMTRDSATAIDWAQLLSSSERLRAFAEQHRRPVGRTRSGKGDLLLEPGTAWHTPAHARLPSPRFAMEPGPRFAEWLDQA